LKDADINNALLKREKIRDDAIAGVTVTKKQADALGPLLDRMEQRLEERSQKMRK
jgi:predicted N-formylglutamate amidohydrolase